MIIKKTRILIVDDDSDIPLTFTKALEVYSQFEADTFNDPSKLYLDLKSRHMTY